MASTTQSSSTNLSELDLHELEQQFKLEMPDNLVKIDGGGMASYWQSSEGAQTARDAAEEFFRTMTKLPGVDSCTVRLEHQGASTLILSWARDPEGSSTGDSSSFGGSPEQARMSGSSMENTS